MNLRSGLTGSQGVNEKSSLVPECEFYCCNRSCHDKHFGCKCKMKWTACVCRLDEAPGKWGRLLKVCWLTERKEYFSFSDEHLHS